MDDFIEFLKIVAQSPPQLSIALIGVAIRDAWLQILCTGIIVGGSALLWQKWRKKRQSKGMEWHDAVMFEAEEPATLPQTVNCKCTVEPIAALVDEDVFTEWQKDLIEASGIAFSKDEARNLYAANTRHRIEVTR